MYKLDMFMLITRTVFHRSQLVQLWYTCKVSLLFVFHLPMVSWDTISHSPSSSDVVAVISP